MRIGIGLPAAIPGSPASALGDWAEAAERHRFQSLSVIDCLVYDNLDPLVALAAALAATVTTVEYLDRELERLDDAGCDDLVRLPCGADLHQIDLLADALSVLGTANERYRVTA